MYQTLREGIIGILFTPKKKNSASLLLSTLFPVLEIMKTHSSVFDDIIIA